MDEIGNLFLQTRTTAGVSLKEVSEDLNITIEKLENIEDGKIGAFSDVFLLKEYVYNYAKYLGLDADKIIDEFSEYVFETTSKIPIKEIEKRMNAQEDDKDKIVSPYTRKEKKFNSGLYLFACIVIVIIIIFATFWSIKQITINSRSASSISYNN